MNVPVTAAPGLVSHRKEYRHCAIEVLHRKKDHEWSVCSLRGDNRKHTRVRTRVVESCDIGVHGLGWQSTCSAASADRTTTTHDEERYGNRDELHTS
jgi:hypothetical protein